MESMIMVQDIKKYYRIAKRDKGITASLRYLFNRKYEIRKAVDEVSFSIKRGEIVGFIGPNGAGKSSTIKILSGILYPDAGKVNIKGYIPYKQRKQYVKNIGVVIGQKSQLICDLPLIQSFAPMKFMYSIH